MDRELEAGIDFREVVDNLIDGVLITNGEGITLFVNDAYCRHSDIRQEDIVGRSVFDMAEEGVLFKHSVSADVIRSKRKVTGAGFMREVDGKSVSGYASGVPVFDSDGGIKMVVSTVVDADKLKTRFDEFKGSAAGDSEAVRILRERVTDEGMFVGGDPEIEKILRVIAQAAPTDVTVLITGESGVGKEVIADRIQRLSRRKDAPYVKVNCTAIPANLLESELFGYEKGAFTGANPQGKPGLFEIADKGTILLDEIGDLPIELQTKLLRALQEKEVLRVGGSKTRRLDVRVIAATNSNLRQKIAEGKFREDLYYRLSVVPIDIPPLRARPGDVTDLARCFFGEYCEKHGRQLVLPDSAERLFLGYNWPGNIRELQNVIEYLVICSEDGVFDEGKLSELLDIPVSQGADTETRGLREIVEDFEKRLVAGAISREGGVRKAAAYLKTDPSTVSRKAKKYNIPLESGEQ